MCEFNYPSQHQPLPPSLLGLGPSQVLESRPPSHRTALQRLIPSRGGTQRSPLNASIPEQAQNMSESPKTGTGSRQVSEGLMRTPPLCHPVPLGLGGAGSEGQRWG